MKHEIEVIPKLTMKWSWTRQHGKYPFADMFQPRFVTFLPSTILKKPTTFTPSSATFAHRSALP
jgi:hypothetical protein